MRSSKTLASLLSAALMAGVLSAQTTREYEAGNHAPGVANGQDYYDILDLDARFCFGLDSGAKQGQMFAGTFLPDGVYVDAGGREIKGTAELARLAAASSGGVSNRRHFTINVRMQNADGGMRQWSYLLVTGPSGDREGVIEGGQYWDELIQTAQGWRIKRRTLLTPGTPRPEAAAFFSLKGTPDVEPKRRDSRDGLTAQDRAEIFQLYAHYPYALDKALDNGQLFANLFTPEGTMAAADGTTVTGRAQLAEFVWRRGLTDLKTYVTNVMLDATPAGVEAKAYVMDASLPQLPAASSIAPVGVFVDQIVKTPVGWKFQHKSLVPFRAGFSALDTSNGHPLTIAAKRASGTVKAELSADDYAAVQQLYARYAHGFDSKADDGALYLSVYTKTGRFTDQYNKIVDGFADLEKNYAHSQSGQPNPIGIGHSTWNLMVDPAPWGAVGRSCTGGGRVNASGAALSPGLLGEYLDMAVKTADGWRFERRIFRQDFQRPPGQVGGPRPPGAQR